MISTRLGYLLLRHQTRCNPANCSSLNKLRICQISSTNGHPTMTKRSSDDINSSNRCGIVYVQRSDDHKLLIISFDYVSAEKSKRFNLRREALDPLASSLERIRLNISKINKPKKLKSGDKIQEHDAKVSLKVPGKTASPTDLSNADAWVEGAILDIDGQAFEIRTNEPQVESMHLPTYIMKGFFTIPVINLINCEISDCLFTWYREISSKRRNVMISNGEASEQDFKVFSDLKIGYKVHEGIIYSPVDDDLTHHLRVVCFPRTGDKEGLDYHIRSTNPVEMGPDSCPFEKRHTMTPTRLTGQDNFRFVTYNILANLYADSHYSRTVLFAHCPTHALEIEYRRQLLMKELLGYNADIVCLQEVDRKEYSRTYEPSFRLVAGYSGQYHAKGNVGEGLATFYARDKFELIETHRTSLRHLIDPKMQTFNLQNNDQKDVSELIEEPPITDATSLNNILEDHPLLNTIESKEAMNCLRYFEDIRQVILSGRALAKRFLERQTVLQTTLLRCIGRSDRYVLVANTHLYFAPDADHIRLLQGSVCSRYIEYIKDYYAGQLRSNSEGLEPVINVVFCGDMNSVPECGLYRLLTEGKIPKDLPDWTCHAEEQVTNLSLEGKIRYKSAYEDIPYTNYTPGFKGCLDYIYYEVEGLYCNSVVPLPDHEDVIVCDGIPSDVFPSDHLALVANFSYKNL